ncbi:MAG: cytochrome c3 family protein [bacterium]
MRRKSGKYGFMSLLCVIIILITSGKIKHALGSAGTDPHMILLTPKNEAFISVETVHFVLQITPLIASNERLQVTHNNSFSNEIYLRAQHRSYERSYFHFSLKLDIGHNIITINLVDNEGKVMDTTHIELLYGDGPTTPIINVGNGPFIWRRLDQDKLSQGVCEYKFHTHDQELACDKCHDMSSSQSKPDEASSKHCYSCHDSVGKGKNVHTGIRTSRACLACHEKDKTITKKVCISCHQQRNGAFLSRQFMHAPLASGECWTCHNPHGGETQYRTHKEVNKLCTSCHTGAHYGGVEVMNHPILDDMNQPTFAGRKYSCTNCHDPHGSDVNKYMLITDTKGPNENCRNCHTRY